MKLTTTLFVFFVLCCAISINAKPVREDKQSISLQEHIKEIYSLAELNHTLRRTKRQVLTDEKCPKGFLKITLSGKKNYCVKCSKEDLCS